MPRTIQPELLTMSELQGVLRRVLRMAFGEESPNCGLVITLVAFTGILAREYINLGGPQEEVTTLVDILVDTLIINGGSLLLEQ